MLEVMEDQPIPKKTWTELAAEYPDVPGYKMLAEAEAEWKRNGGFGIFDYMVDRKPDSPQKP
jgi:hypothetical protein